MRPVTCLPRALDGLDVGTLTAGLAARPTVEGARLAVTATAALVEAVCEALPAAVQRSVHGS